MDLRDRPVLVTGGAGLIGSFLVDRLLEIGARVIVADDFSKGRREHLAHNADAIDIREGDLEQPGAMQRALDGVDIVFHLASRAYGVGYSSGNHLSILEHNERITNNLVQCLRRWPIAHLLVTSSSCVYSDNGPDTLDERPLFEGEPESANRGYGWAKRFLEQKATLLSRETGIPLAIVRPFNIYGERYAWVGAFSQAIPMQIKKVLDGDDPVVIWGSGCQRRNYMHAFDCAGIMAQLVESGFVGTVNIGTEVTIAVSDLVRTICRLAGRSPRLTFDTTKPEGRAIKSADSSLLRRVCPDFRESVNLDAGLQRMFVWYDRTFGGTP